MLPNRGEIIIYYKFLHPVIRGFMYTLIPGAFFYNEALLDALMLDCARSRFSYQISAPVFVFDEWYSMPEQTFPIIKRPDGFKNEINGRNNSRF
jgi:hypothetical protein